MITDKPIDLNSFLTAAPDPSCGGSASFVGTVRDHHDGKPVRKLLYECYRSMAEKKIDELTQCVRQTTGVMSLRIIHRVGELGVGEAAVAVAADAPHRAEAFRACRMLIDEVKSQAPIWKKEFYIDGTTSWTSCHYPELNERGGSHVHEINHKA